MENKVNIAELLKDCPQGMKLYSPLCGTCVFDRLNMGTIICKKQNTEEITFTSEGYYMLPVFDDCECMLFPSKDQRDWNEFQVSFKDGDIVATTNGIWIGITTGGKSNEDIPIYCIINSNNNFEAYLEDKQTWMFKRLATEEEKEKLFQAIEENGYKWNADTKTLEKIVEPKFKVGDRIKHGLTGEIYTVMFVLPHGGGTYEVAITNEIGKSIRINEQDNYELVPNKFDISTLIPFESRVLVRHYKHNKWCGAFFSFIHDDVFGYKFITIGGQGYPMMIPYEGNEYLLGTTDDCDEFYKTWKD